MSSRLATVVATLTLAIASPAFGQATKQFNNFCTVGAVRTCASVHVWTVWDPVSLVTRVQLWVRNLQGAMQEDNTGGSAITRIGLTAPKISWPNNLQLSTQGATVAGNPSSYWTISNQMIEGPITFSTTSKTVEGGIQGCSIYPPSVANYFQTCSAGWVIFGFTTTNQWTADQAQIAWKIQTNANDQQIYACRTGDQPGDPEYCAPPVGDPTATPEPISIALLGSGLAGLAAIRRKRQANGDVSDDV